MGNKSFLLETLNWKSLKYVHVRVHYSNKCSPLIMIRNIPYSAKRWQWKTLANSTGNYIGKKMANSNEK